MVFADKIPKSLARKNCRWLLSSVTIKSNLESFICTQAFCILSEIMENMAT